MSSAAASPADPARAAVPPWMEADTMTARVVSTAAAAAARWPPAFRDGSFQAREVKDFREWTDVVNSHFPWLEHRNHCGSAFTASLRTLRFGNSHFAMITAGSSEVRRTRQLAAAAESGHIKLIWQLAGSLDIEQERCGAVIRRGQSTVIDTSRSYRCRLSEGAQFAVLTLPHEACPGWLRISRSLCGTVLAAPSALRAALGAVMALTDPALGDCDEGGDSVLRAVQSLVTTSLHQSAEGPEQAGHNGSRLRLAQQHILSRIGDPDLDPDELASALCMSRRSLYMLFKQHRTTPSKMIHDLRLQCCRQVLDEPAHLGRKITDIAFDHGFSDYATFSRLFKQQFGVTPSEFRLHGRGAPLS